MGDIGLFLDRVDRGIRDTRGRIDDLLQQFPFGDNIFRAMTAQVFEIRPNPPEEALFPFNVLLKLYSIPLAKHIYIQECEYIDPYQPLERRPICEQTGRINYSDPREFPLSDMTPGHTRVLLPYCFKQLSWFLVEVILGPMPQTDNEERQAKVKVYTNYAECVNKIKTNGWSVADWVHELLTFASHLPTSPMTAVDWTNKVVEEVFIPQLMSLGYLGAIVATIFIANKGSAIILLNHTPDIGREARLACIQVIEQFILGMNYQPCTPFDLPDKLLRLLQPRRSGASPSAVSAQAPSQP